MITIAGGIILAVLGLYALGIALAIVISIIEMIFEPETKPGEGYDL